MLHRGVAYGRGGPGIFDQAFRDPMSAPHKMKIIVWPFYVTFWFNYIY